MEPNQILYIAGGLLILSEALALIPAIKSNSVFTAIVNTLKWIARK